MFLPQSPSLLKWWDSTAKDHTKCTPQPGPKTFAVADRADLQLTNVGVTNASTPPPPPCISYAKVHNYYSPYTYCSLDKGVACAQHIQLPTHTCAGHMC